MPSKRQERQELLKGNFEGIYDNPVSDYYKMSVTGRTEMLKKYLVTMTYAVFDDDVEESYKKAINSKNTEVMLEQIAENIQNWEVAKDLLRESALFRVVFDGILKLGNDFDKMSVRNAADMFINGIIPNTCEKNEKELNFTGKNTQYTEFESILRDKGSMPEQIEFLVDYHASVTARIKNGETIPEAEMILKKRWEDHIFDTYVTHGTKEERQLFFKTLGKLKGKSYADMRDDQMQIKAKLEGGPDAASSEAKSFWLARRLKSGIKLDAVDDIIKRAGEVFKDAVAENKHQKIEAGIKALVNEGVEDYIDDLKLKDGESRDITLLGRTIDEGDKVPAEIQAWSADKGPRYLNDPKSEFSLKKANEAVTEEFHAKHVNKTYDNALKLFNTKRASFFRKESNTHAKVRIAAENLMKTQNSSGYGSLEDTLNAADNIQAKKEIAKKWLNAARTLHYEAASYSSTKNPYSFAGRDRHAGAVQLCDLAEEEFLKCENAIQKTPGLNLSEIYKELAAENRAKALAEFKDLDLSVPTAKKNGRSIDDQILDQQKAVYHAVFKVVASHYAEAEMVGYPGNTQKGNYFSVLAKLEKNVNMAMAVKSYMESNWDKDTLLQDLSDPKMTKIAKHLRTKGVNLDKIINPDRVEAQKKEQVQAQR